MNKKFLKQGLNGLLVTAISFSLYGCGNKTTPVSAEKVVQTNSTDQSVALSAKVKPSLEVDIVSKISGKIAAVNFKEGQQVNAGDILFTLDDKDLKTQVSQAEAALNVAKANYEKITGSAVRQQDNQNRSSVEVAQAEYDVASAALEEEKKKQDPNTSVQSAQVKYLDAKDKLDKKQKLFDAGVASQSELDAAKNDVKYAEDQLNSAKNAYNNSKIAQEQSLSAAEARVRKAEEALRSAKEIQDNIQPKVNSDNANVALAQVSQAEAALNTAKTQLDNTVIKSPATGVIAIKNIEVGEMVGSATVAAKVVDLSSVTVEVNVQENLVSSLKLGDKVKVLVNSADSNPFEGEVTNISPVADVKAQSFPVKITVKNEKGLLKGDMFAEVLLNGNKASQ